VEWARSRTWWPYRDIGTDTSCVITASLLQRFGGRLALSLPRLTASSGRKPGEIHEPEEHHGPGAARRLGAYSVE
jgi:hypothetical protein